MTNPVGSFIWYELMTTDPDAAARFYGAVVGWTVEGSGPNPAAGGMDYRMIRRDDGRMAGGLLALTAEMTAGGARPWWLPYLYVADVEAAVTAIEADGGKVQMPATDLAVGRIAMVADPQGVPIYLMDPTPPPHDPQADSDVFDETAAQRVRWNELSSPDQAASTAFYAKHFGFAFDDKMPMGELGDYCFISHHGKTLGAIMQKQDDNPPAWLMYFGVPSIAAAHETVTAEGGAVLWGPQEVPGGDWVIVAADPQGAIFGLVGPKGDGS
jgi:predicted enzyme related to lactoylglutathione lyase